MITTKNGKNYVKMNNGARFRVDASGSGGTVSVILTPTNQKARNMGPGMAETLRGLDLTSCIPQA